VLCMRIMGKRQVGELQPSELVITILISELASIPMQDLNRPVTNGVIAILVLVLLELIISALTLKSMFFRKVFEGKSAIIIKNGIIDQKMMKKLRITIDDLLEGLRQAGNFSVDKVNYAIMETNGTISVQLKEAFDTVTKRDMKIKTENEGMPTVIISDGNFIDKVFDNFDCISKEDALKELQKNDLSESEVFLMTANESGEFYIVRKEA
ncbi:MAG: DUF421 domain-containing protein, partial [Clostridia bacterium]|nr:DUF421 domain-containing protein [Clostridia bacterium]